MERTYRSTLTDCACDLWAVVASPFCNRFLPVSKHFLFGHLVLGPHTLDLLCEDKVSILQHTEGGDDPAKYEVCCFRIREGNMDPKAVLPVSRVRHRVRAGAQVRRRLIPAADRAAPLQHLTAQARQCHTSRQFHELLNALQPVLPFHRLICAWGYSSRETIRFIFNHSFPIPFVRWYLTKGLLWQGPMFREWLRTNRSQVSDEVWRRLAQRVDPELLEQAKRFKLQGLLAGGLRSRGFWIFFSLCMGSEDKCRAYRPQFDLIVPIVAQALKRACPRALLSKRETSILERRAMGEITKQIAAAEGISERTVREHMEHIKRKLYTDDLLNAVVIAVKNGMILQSWKK